jgi:hypothetical protein
MGVANVLFHTADIDLCATEATRRSVGALRRHLHASTPHGVFPRSPITMLAPSLEVSFSPRRQEVAPRRFEAGAGGFERRTGPATAFARIGARVEAATPLPLIDIVRDAGPPADRPDTDSP